MKICWFGIYDPGYSRNKILIDGLRDNDVEVIECNDRSKGLVKYIHLVRKLIRLRNEYDYLYCAFPVYISIILAFLFQKRPIVVDAFFSKFEANVHDRKTHFKYHPTALFFFLLDRLMVALSDLVIVDTNEHKKFFSKWRNQDSIHVVPVGVHMAEFFPILHEEKNTSFLVQFHGSYIPLQGIDRIVAAAHILRDEKAVRFRFIGNGQEYKMIRDLVLKQNLAIEFLPWLPIEELNKKLNEADVILGIFGDTLKTDKVIPNKLYQGLAVKKPLITKNTPAVRERFTDNDLILTSNDPAEIAEAIIKLYKDPILRKNLAESGYKKIQEEFTQKQIAAAFLSALEHIRKE